MDTRMCGILFLICFFISIQCATENLGTMRLYEAMQSQRVKANKFASWCDQAELSQFLNGDSRLTVFVFNDSSYTQISTEDRRILDSISNYKDYLESFILNSEENIDSWSDGRRLPTINGKALFVNKKRRTFTGPGGTAGTLATYINGAMIDTSYQTINGLIHKMVRPLLPISSENVYRWLTNNEFNIDTRKWSELIDKVRINHIQAIDPLSVRGGQITFLVPSQSALDKIPSQKFNGLADIELADYFKMHYIPNKAVFTSYLEHQEYYQTGYTSNNAIFMVQDNRVLVRSGGVTAQIIQGNITTENGVIHIIDRMLGFVYFSTREQLDADRSGLTGQFTSLITRLTPDISQAISRTGANVFVPIDEAFRRVEMYRGINFASNVSLADYVFRLCVLRDSSIEVSRINGNYDVRDRRVTMYNDMRLVVFNDRNESWVNSGHVRAKIIRPDIDTTNQGRLQYIDAVPGVPWMDIPTTIEYDEHLIYTWNDIKMVGLDNYLKDPRFNPTGATLPAKSFFDGSNGVNVFTTTPDPWNTNNNNQWSQWSNTNNQWSQWSNTNNQWSNTNNQWNNNQQQNTAAYHQCGSVQNVCRMTFFVPNGTATYYYAMTQYGRQIRTQPDRYRYMMRRLIVHGEIYLEQMPAMSQSLTFKTDTGENILVKKESDSVARVYWSGMAAQVIMWDLGASNGVVHIIDQFLSDHTDLNRDISASAITTASLLVSVLALFLVKLLR